MTTPEGGERESAEHDWFQARLAGLSRNDATRLGLLLVSSREHPGPWHRRQLFSQLVAWEAASGAHPNTHQDSIQELRDLGYLTQGEADGDWISNPSAFDWIEDNFPGAPPGRRPIAGARLFGTTYGRVFDTEFEIFYERGKIVGVQMLGRGFRYPTDAVDALREAGRYVDGRWRDWNPPDLLEAHLHGYNWFDAGPMTQARQA